MGKFVYIMVLILLTFVCQSRADITETTCTPSDNENGDKKCQAEDENAVCTGTTDSTTHCQCKTDFFFSSDKTQCVKQITTVGCTPGNTGTAACQQVDAHSECKTGATMCTCKAGYAGTDFCSKVLGGTCSTDGGECSGAVENSVCTAQKCECAANFIEESAICKTALGKECTGTGQSTCVLNAECDEKECNCLSGFKDTNGLCAAESSATSAWVTSSLLVTSLLIYLPSLILW